MSRHLNALSPRFRPIAFELLSRFTEAGIAVMIVCTGRTAEEQAQAVATGHSKVTHSKHQDGDAIDIVPFEQFLLHGEDKLQWNTNDKAWLMIGEIGEAIPNIRWGGRFKPLNAIGVGWDPGHFEYQETKPTTVTV